MPITFYPFTPQPTSPPFEFQPTLDGNDWGAVVTWNAFGQRWYITLSNASAQRVFTQALIGSPEAVDLQTVTWANGRVFITGIIPWSTLGFVPGVTYEITVRNCLPDAYNGRRLQALAHDEVTLSYPLAVPPGNAIGLGQGSYDIDMAGLYFKTSTLVFRQGTQQFEVFSP